MTIAVALKVRDGIVMAADSATTLQHLNGETANIYNHANKIVNLRKGKPVGLMTWGQGGFGSANIAMLAKDFRAERWATTFPDDAYEIETVAAAMRDFFIEAADGDDVDAFGFMIAGHSPGKTLGEAWVVEHVPGEGWREPQGVLDGEHGAAFYGQPRWIQRLVLGFDGGGLATALVDDLGLPEDELMDAMLAVKARSEAGFVHPAMPIQDAINLGFFLVEVTKGATQFAPGDLTVGGPTEVAAITKHEGFKWVARKHYFDSVLNPPAPTMEAT